MTDTSTVCTLLVNSFCCLSHSDRGGSTVTNREWVVGFLTRWVPKGVAPLPNTWWILRGDCTDPSGLQPGPPGRAMWGHDSCMGVKLGSWMDGAMTDGWCHD
jgi:hypothetical protein